MIKLKLLSKKIKIPFESRENILAIYSPRKYIIPEADTVTVDTEINIVLPLNTTLYMTTKFKEHKNQRDSGPSKKEIKNYAVESILSCREKKAQASEAVHVESVGLEKFLAKKEEVGGRVEDFSAVTTSPMQATTWSIKPVKLLPVLLARQRQTLTKLPNRELIRRLEMGNQNRTRATQNH